jgi:hypothetical protein
VKPTVALVCLLLSSIMPVPSLLGAEALPSLCRHLITVQAPVKVRTKTWRASLHFPHLVVSPRGSYWSRAGAPVSHHHLLYPWSIVNQHHPRSRIYGLDPPDSIFKNKSNLENAHYLCTKAPVFLQNQAAIHKNSKQSPWNPKVFAHVALITF